MSTETNFPLTWPISVPRAKRRNRGPFRRVSVAKAVDDVRREVRLAGGANLVISTNVRTNRDGLPRSGEAQPSDPGVAVYFNRDDKRLCFPCDRWTSVDINLVAIARHIEAIRGTERWGVGSIEQAFAGYAALPAPGVRAWRDVLGKLGTIEEVDARFRELAKTKHPDQGGDAEGFALLTKARDDARRELGGAS